MGEGYVGDSTISQNIVDFFVKKKKKKEESGNIIQQMGDRKMCLINIFLILIMDHMSTYLYLHLFLLIVSFFQPETLH